MSTLTLALTCRPSRLARRPPRSVAPGDDGAARLLGLVHHSDRGSVYASGDYRDALKAIGAVASMSRKGDCWDNAVAESFFATIKGKMLDERDFETRAEANVALTDNIDAFYNASRLHSTIGYVSPIEFELKSRR
jgi:putative transposase